jgi:hypothetical protein
MLDICTSQLPTNNFGWLSPNASITSYEDPLLPDNFVGSAVVQSSQPIAAEIHETGSVRKMASNVFQPTGAKTSYAVRICHGCSDGYNTGLRVMNVGTEAADVTINYFDWSGYWLGMEIIPGLDIFTANNASQIPSGIYGSAVISSSQPIIAVIYLTDPDTTKDLAMTYSAPNR